MPQKSQIELSKLYGNMQGELKKSLELGANAVRHSGTKGDNTEANWIQWFREHLPNRYKIDKGIIIDYTGKQSEQIDLIIYDAQYSYLVFHQNNTLVIPAESVYAVFEIKQRLNKRYIEEAQRKAKSVRILERTSAQITHVNGVSQPKKLHEILAGILTTKSDWKNTVERVMENIKKEDKEDRYKRLDFICSISNTTFVIENAIFVEQKEEKTSISYCNSEEQSLVYLLLNLLRKLRDIGTVPAIDFEKYGQGIESHSCEWDNDSIK